MSWSDRLKAARNLLQLGQEQMAERLGISYRTYHGYENGASEPKVGANRSTAHDLPQLAREKH